MFLGGDQIGLVLTVEIGSLLHRLTRLTVTFCCVLNYLGRDQKAAERRFTA
jgi:hypothetical protein